MAKAAVTGTLKGWGIKAQIGRTHFYIRSWPFYWEWETSMMAPNLYGFGVWVTRDRWA